MPDAAEIVQLLRQRGAAGDAADHHLVGLFIDVYRQLAAETPQWLGLLHAAAREGLVELSPASLGAMKSLALAGSGAGEGAWRWLHPRGDAALIGSRLLPAFGNLLGLLKINAALPPAGVPDQRLIDALCDDDQYALRSLPAAAVTMPSSVIAAAVRALRRQPADFSDADATLGLRDPRRQVFDRRWLERAQSLRRVRRALRLEPPGRHGARLARAAPGSGGALGAAAAAARTSPGGGAAAHAHRTRARVAADGQLPRQRRTRAGGASPRPGLLLDP
ncbi:MAG: hypothetical protein U5L03_11685 [Burkholderiaceae bacterium]|nr:hypothetical protein [Burkholderiaceae bacterium]